jgi:hypothetical protein
VIEGPIDQSGKQIVLEAEWKFVHRCDSALFVLSDCYMEEDDDHITLFCSNTEDGSIE